VTPSEIINQDRIWVDRSGRELLLEKMEPGYLCNLVPFLRGNVCTIYRLCHPDAVEAGELKPTNEEQLRSLAEEWLVHTPLMRRILELVRGIPFEERQKIHAANRAYEELTGYEKLRLG
jgi:hypothetical protein